MDQCSEIGNIILQVFFYVNHIIFHHMYIFRLQYKNLAIHNTDTICLWNVIRKIQTGKTSKIRQKGRYSLYIGPIQRDIIWANRDQLYYRQEILCSNLKDNVVNLIIVYRDRLGNKRRTLTCICEPVKSRISFVLNIFSYILCWLMLVLLVYAIWSMYVALRCALSFNYLYVCV